MDTLQQIGDRIKANFDSKNQAREHALRLCRETIQSSALAIRAIHRGEIDTASERIAIARASITRANDELHDFPDILFAGFVHDASKEYAEASLVFALVNNHQLPEPEMLGVGYAAYLHGLAEAVGELRRYLLDYLRQGEVDRCERLLDAMDDIYSLLVVMDYPDAITAGLRRATDVTRGILEKTRGDYTVAVRQRDLELTLTRLEQTMIERGN